MKAAQLTNDDVDELEQAFAESSAIPAEQVALPKKRTREEIIRELKQKRTAEEGGQAPKAGDLNPLEEAKQKGKFKPIGFKPVDSSLTGNKRKESGEGEKKKKKKKRKIAEGEKNNPEPAPPTNKMVPAPTSFERLKPPDINEDFDIFAGAGDYTGVEIDDEEELDEEATRNSSAHNTVVETAETSSTSMPLGRWIAVDDEPAQILPGRLPLPPQPTPVESKEETEALDKEEEKPMRLAPLESSAVPSVKDLLAMDDAAIKYEKKQKRKEKKRKRGGSDDD